MRAQLEASTMAAVELRGAANLFVGNEVWHRHKSDVKVTQVIGHSIDPRGLQVISELQSDRHQIVIRSSSNIASLYVTYSNCYTGVVHRRTETSRCSRRAHTREDALTARRREDDLPQPVG